MKMEPIVSSETSAIRTQTPRNYPKSNNLHILYVLILLGNKVEGFGVVVISLLLCVLPVSHFNLSFLAYLV